MSYELLQPKTSKRYRKLTKSTKLLIGLAHHFKACWCALCESIG